MSVGSLARPPPRRRSLARGSTSLALISKVSRASTKRRAAAPPCRCPVPARSGAAPWHHALCRFGAASGELRLLSLDGARDGCAALQVSGVLIIAKGHASASELKRVIQRITSEPAIATPRLLVKLRRSGGFRRGHSSPALDVSRSGVRKSGKLIGCAYALPYAYARAACASLRASSAPTFGCARRAWQTVGGAGRRAGCSVVSGLLGTPAAVGVIDAPLSAKCAPWHMAGVESPMLMLCALSSRTPRELFGGRRPPAAMPVVPLRSSFA